MARPKGSKNKAKEEVSAVSQSPVREESLPETVTTTTSTNILVEYNVLSSLNHNGQIYQKGDKILFKDEPVDLIEAGVLKK